MIETRRDKVRLIALVLFVGIVEFALGWWSGILYPQ